MTLKVRMGVLTVALAVVGLVIAVAQVTRRNAALPEGEHLSLALRIQPATLWYQSPTASRFFLADADSSSWCDMHLLAVNGIDVVTIAGAKLVYLLQLHEAHVAGSFEHLDQPLLRELIDVGVHRCDINHQPEPPKEFENFVGPHRALVYAAMSGDLALYNRLIVQGATTDFDVRSKSGRSIPFAQFHETLRRK